MIEDKDLDEFEKQKESEALIAPKTNFVAEAKDDKPVIETQFSKQMDDVKQNVLKEAAITDNQFVDKIKQNVKEAAVKLTEVEKDKANYQKQQVGYESEKLQTKQQENTHKQDENKWDNKRKRRQFHFDGVKPIMNFVGINEPMNLVFLYLFAVILTPIYLVAKFVKGTFGTLLAGASNGDRSKMARGFLWTLLCVSVVVVLVCLIYLFLKWQGIDIFANIK